MPTKYTVTLTTLGTSSVIVLPKPVVDGFNLGKGQRLELIVRDDGIYIPLTEHDPQTKSSDQSDVV
ncbi:MAG: AbrB/MazE/SpoVT family DNA-binding domain-containing protein [Nitrososphaeraceae archaeon]|jgi:bifunctional DNA-binding transcriptional regulator/antitoxin component of YhaV-PrlF toxin-antitoxin module